jgi:pyruvate carboxylase subunit A
MFRRVLIANRGEIACRVVRALRAVGAESIAIYSDADQGALHTKVADRAYRVGAADAAASYLNGARILEIAKKSGAEALHPGYGFLSENADFAEAVQKAGLVWIGPPPEAMRAIGNKVSARALAQKSGVPTAPGSPGRLRDPEEAVRIAQDIGYPVLLKAASGGGGIGMRVVRKKEEMRKEFEGAQATAKGAFGDDSLFLEKYLERPRHIELQVVGDGKGRVVHLGERECSIQRRHQKLLEEAPSVAIGADARRKLGELGVKLMKAAGYANAGTLEFLYQDGQFFFNEVNARLQVEHPVTERVYGVDLVQAQLRVAAGEGLPFQQSDLKPNGHCIEVRINAEDPLRDFAPTPGLIRRWHIPVGEGVRVDAGVEAGWRVPAEYDSLLAKVIVWGATRMEAVERLSKTLAGARIDGTPTNLAFHRVLLQDERFRAGDLSTRFLEERKTVDRLREARAETRRQALLIASALSYSPRGGPGVVAARARRPPRVGGTP